MYGGPQISQPVRTEGPLRKKNEEYISQSCHFPEQDRKDGIYFAPVATSYGIYGQQISIFDGDINEGKKYCNEWESWVGKCEKWSEYGGP